MSIKEKQLLTIDREELLCFKSVPWTRQEIEKAVADGTPRKDAEAMRHGRRAQPVEITVDAWKTEVREMMAD